MLWVHHFFLLGSIFFLSFVANKFVGRFYWVCLFACLCDYCIHVLLQSLHCLLCVRARECIRPFLSMFFHACACANFISHRNVVSFLSLTHSKGILFHLLRSVHAYYFSDYIKINGCFESKKWEQNVLHVCIEKTVDKNAFAQIQKRT